MGFFRDFGKLMVEGSRSFARWELDNARVIMGDRRRLALLGLLLVPVIVGSVAFAEEVSQALPGFIGGKEAYGPSYYSLFIFLVSIAVGMGAGLISGCIGAGGGFIIAPALMSAGVKGILAVGTDLFHIFAKAIMGSVLHRKMGNVSVP
ncbi:MAG: sulfite exporter TauE/SafE family protein, partial [Chloroflexi bacterium]|nr:sulfite exporter TauE/SafE family protein [Chloroflexota bacterium]